MGEEKGRLCRRDGRRDRGCLGGGECVIVGEG